MENIVFIFLIVCLVAVCVIPISSTFIKDGNVFYNINYSFDNYNIFILPLFS